MKKTAAILLTGMLVLSTGSMSAFAAGRECRQGAYREDCENVCVCKEEGRIFVDEDGNGICDNCRAEKKDGKNYGRGKGKFCKTGERRCEVNRK